MSSILSRSVPISLLPAVFLLAGAVPAQISFPLTISDSCAGNTGTFDLRSLPSSPTASFSTVGNVDFGASGSCAPDVMYGHYALIRFGSDTRNTAFYDSGLKGDQGGIVTSSSPDGFTIHWPDVDNRGLLSATWCARIRCCGSNGTFVDHEWKFASYEGPYKKYGPLGKTGPSTTTFEFFAYSDIDMAGSWSGNESDPGSASHRHLISHPSCPGERAEFFGESISNWEIAAWPALANSLVADPFVGLANATLPFGPIDYSGCMSWSLTVDSYITTRKIRYSHAVNCLQCATDPVVANLGVGSASISTTALGSLGSPIDLSVTGGQTGAPGTILFGLPSADIPLSVVFPACTNTLYVSSPISTIPISTDGTGAASLAFPGLFGPNLCGASLDFQYGALDFVGACPVVLSDYVRVTFGRLQLATCFPEW